VGCWRVEFSAQPPLGNAISTNVAQRADAARYDASCRPDVPLLTQPFTTLSSGRLSNVSTNLPARARCETGQAIATRLAAFIFAASLLLVFAGSGQAARSSVSLHVGRGFVARGKASGCRTVQIHLRRAHHGRTVKAKVRAGHYRARLRLRHRGRYYVRSYCGRSRSALVRILAQARSPGTAGGSGGTNGGSGAGSIDGPNQSGWRTVVDDQFSTDGPPPSHWRLYNGRYGSGPRHNCASRTHDFVQGGALVLLMSYEVSDPSNTGCGPGWFTGGMQLDRSFASIDQAIELRYRVVDTDPTHVSAWRNIPMHWGDVGTWPKNGEINYCEGSALDGCMTFIHAADGRRRDFHHALDLIKWNTLRVERRRYTVTAWLNGVQNLQFSGDANYAPDVVQRVVLGQECRQVGCPSSGYAGQTERIEIDWIEVQNPA
jgi:hypothetical protein